MFLTISNHLLGECWEPPVDHTTLTCVKHCGTKYAFLWNAIRADLEEAESGVSARSADAATHSSLLSADLMSFRGPPPPPSQTHKSERTVRRSSGLGKTRRREAAPRLPAPAVFHVLGAWLSVLEPGAFSRPEMFQVQASSKRL